MSRAGFAHITSDLLVRKGEAVPWTMPSAERDAAPAPRPAAPREERQSFGTRQAAYAAPAPDYVAAPRAERHPAERHTANDDADEHSKRCTLRLSPREYEQLGIIAVKKEISRQHVLREAIEHYLTAAKRKYRAECGCLGGACRGAC